MPNLKKYWFSLGVAGVFITHTILSYWAVIRDRYPVAPGDDIMVHLRNTVTLMSQDKFWIAGKYPPGFHYVLIWLSRITGISVITLSSYIWPALLVFSALAILMLATKVFGRKVGLLTYLLYALVSLQPLQTAWDGGLPNVLASNTLLPLALLFLIYFVEATKVKARLVNLSIFLITAVLIIISHHLSTIVLFGVVAVSLLTYGLIKKLYKRQWPNWKELTIFTLVAGTVYLIIMSPFLESARVLALRSLTGNYSPVLSIPIYSKDINGLIFQFAWVGLLFSGINCFRGQQLGQVVTISWFLLYFVTSRSTQIVEPERLVRDLAMPASLLAASAIVTIHGFLKVSKIWQWFYVSILVGLVVFSIGTKMHRWIQYNPMVRFSAADQEAYQSVLSSHRSNETTILVKGRSWEVITLLRGTTYQFRKVTTILPSTVPNEPGCYLVGWYKPHVWPSDLGDHSLVDQFLSNKNFSLIQTFSDPNKVWDLFCTRTER